MASDDKNLGEGLTKGKGPVVKRITAIDSVTRGSLRTVVQPDDINNEEDPEQVVDELTDGLEYSDFQGPLTGFGMKYPGALQSVRNGKRRSVSQEEEESDHRDYGTVKTAIKKAVKDLRDDLSADWSDDKDSVELVTVYVMEKYEDLFDEDTISEVIQRYF